MKARHELRETQRQNPCKAGKATREGERALTAAAPPRRCKYPSWHSLSCGIRFIDVCAAWQNLPAHSVNRQKTSDIRSLAKCFHSGVPREISPDSAGTSKHLQGRSALISSKVSCERAGSQRKLNSKIHHISSSQDFLLSLFISFTQLIYLTHSYLWMRETDQKKQHPRINLWQRIWLLTGKSAVFSLICDPEERFITAELGLRALSCHLLKHTDPARCLACESEAGRSEGQEATFTIMLQHRVTDEERGCPGEGAQCRKHSSFPQDTDGWETIPKAVGRKAGGSLPGRTETGLNLFSNNSQLLSQG